MFESRTSHPATLDVAATFTNANILSVRVESTGFCGGDAGHGGRTKITLVDESSTDIVATFIEASKTVVIEVSGDAELTTLAGAFQFVANQLGRLTGPVAPDPPEPVFVDWQARARLADEKLDKYKHVFGYLDNFAGT